MTIYQWTIFETNNYTFTYIEATDKHEAYLKAYKYYLDNDWDIVEWDSTPKLSFSQFKNLTNTHVQYPDYSEEYDFHEIRLEVVE